MPVLVSLKGQNDDAIDVAKSIVGRKAEHAILITGDPNGPAALVLRGMREGLSISTMSYPEKDSRFVNCKSIFSLSALSYLLVRQAFGPQFIESIEDASLMVAFARAKARSEAIAHGIASVANWENKQLVVLCQGTVTELTVPWQAILSESGILTPVCIDIKDYTHGDHLAAVRANNAIFLVLRHRGIENICDIFVERFSTRFPVVVVPLESAGPTRFWENLFFCCNVGESLTGLLGYEGKRPPKDPIVHGWRGWGHPD